MGSAEFVPSYTQVCASDGYLMSKAYPRVNSYCISDHWVDEVTKEVGDDLITLGVDVIAYCNCEDDCCVFLTPNKYPPNPTAPRRIIAMRMRKVFEGFALCCGITV